MANDSASTIDVVDASGTTVTVLATDDGSGDKTFQSTPRTNGGIVTTANPLPVAQQGTATVSISGTPAVTVSGTVTVSQSGTVSTAPATVTLVALDVATVTTGGTAVTALTAGHRTKGGWIKNPESATVNLGINEIGTASGTTSAGSTTFIVPGQTYVLAPTSGAVSVISSDSSHPFSGYGWT